MITTEHQQPQHPFSSSPRPRNHISSVLLGQRKLKLKPATTIVRQTPILSHGWEESAVEGKEIEIERDGQQQIQTGTLSSEDIGSKGEEVSHLIPENGWQEMHGFLGDSQWSAPIKISHCESESRPGYTSKLAHEFEDTPEVLAMKVSLLATLIRQSSNCLIYSGAGISTSSGINDYASQRGSVALETPERPRLRSPYEAQPTLAHHGVVSLYRSGFVKYWIQQNHDGLPQKAGFPQHAINEIHGAWYDPSNPVVAMNGSLRGDLFEEMLKWEEKTDLTISMGTTMCGMNSDRVFVTVATKAKRVAEATQKMRSRPPPFSPGGGVIINLQQTQHDSISALRIFSKLDVVMEMLVQELGLDHLRPLTDYTAYSLISAGINSSSLSSPEKQEGNEEGEDVFEVRYDRHGSLLKDSRHKSSSIFQSISQRFQSSKAKAKPKEVSEPLQSFTTLDLRIGSRVKLVSGPHKGDEGEVIGKNREGHYRIQFMHRIGKAGVRRPFETVMGSWWVEAAVRGTVPTIPVVNL
jgi:hypothetical protein